MDKIKIFNNLVKNKRVSIFIDAANILYSQQSLGWQIDYKKLKRYFESKCKNCKIYFYSGKVSNNKKQEYFFQLMNKFGYIVKTKEVKWIKDKKGNILKGKGNLDIELALDFTHTTNEYDISILLSGDSDFAPAVSFVKKLGKKVITMSTRGHISKELVDSSNIYIPFDKLKNNIKKKSL